MVIRITAISPRLDVTKSKSKSKAMLKDFELPELLSVNIANSRKQS